MTQVPNIIFDVYLPLLSESEMKVLLVVIRQTLGWKDIRTGKRKERDRISGSQFLRKTGLSKRIITTAIAKLTAKGLLEITDTKGNKLVHSADRKGKPYLFYCVKNPVLVPPTACTKNALNLKRYDRKDNNTVKPFRHISELMASKEFSKGTI